jgi:hypothetical protein
MVLLDAVEDSAGSGFDSNGEGNGEGGATKNGGEPDGSFR